MRNTKQLVNIVRKSFNQHDKTTRCILPRIYNKEHIKNIKNSNINRGYSPYIKN